ncbi:patatin-like phospholipase family protein [Persicimonas caeni]|nr:patatin-like phospholipase family protein [Persicimonas caeni]
MEQRTHRHRSHAPRLPAGVALLALAACLHVPFDAPAQEPADQEREQTRRELGLTISGGASLGAYEAGINWALIKYLRSAQARGDAIAYDLTTVTGASAGAVNTLLTTVNWCKDFSQEHRGQPDGQCVSDEQVICNDIDDNIFRNTWMAVGFDADPSLLPRSADGYLDDDGLFTRRAFGRSLEVLDRELGESNFRPECSLDNLGITVTRDVPGKLTKGGLQTYNQRFVVPWRVDVDDGGELRFAYQPIHDGEHPIHNILQLASVLDPSTGQRHVPRRIVFDAVETSSAFPIAFARKQLYYCALECSPQHGLVGSQVVVDGEVLSCPDIEGQPAQICWGDFIDGGVFDNVPLGLAAAMAETRRAARHTPQAPMTYLYMDPDQRRMHGADPTKTRRAIRGPGYSPRGLSFYAEWLEGAIDSARSSELYHTLLDHLWNEGAAALAGRVAQTLTRTSRVYARAAELGVADKLTASELSAADRQALAKLGVRRPDAFAQQQLSLLADNPQPSASDAPTQASRKKQAFALLEAFDEKVELDAADYAATHPCHAVALAQQADDERPVAPAGFAIDDSLHIAAFTGCLLADRHRLADAFFGADGHAAAEGLAQLFGFLAVDYAEAEHRGAPSTQPLRAMILDAIVEAASLAFVRAPSLAPAMRHEARQMAAHAALARRLQSSVERGRRLVLSTRLSPVVGDYFSAFGAFLDKGFRHYDYLVGVYDALHSIASYQCQRQSYYAPHPVSRVGRVPTQTHLNLWSEVTQRCVVERMNAAADALGVDEVADAHFIVASLARQEAQVALGVDGAKRVWADLRRALDKDDATVDNVLFVEQIPPGSPNLQALLEVMMGTRAPCQNHPANETCPTEVDPDAFFERLADAGFTPSPNGVVAMILDKAPGWYFDPVRQITRRMRAIEASDKFAPGVALFDGAQTGVNMAQKVDRVEAEFGRPVDDGLHWLAPYSAAEPAFWTQTLLPNELRLNVATQRERSARVGFEVQWRFAELGFADSGQALGGLSPHYSWNRRRHEVGMELLDYSVRVASDAGIHGARLGVHASYLWDDPAGDWLAVGPRLVVHTRFVDFAVRYNHAWSAVTDPDGRSEVLIGLGFTGLDQLAGAGVYLAPEATRAYDILEQAL